MCYQGHERFSQTHSVQALRALIPLQAQMAVRPMRSDDTDGGMSDNFVGHVLSTSGKSHWPVCSCCCRGDCAKWLLEYPIRDLAA